MKLRQLWIPLMTIAGIAAAPSLALAGFASWQNVNSGSGTAVVVEQLPADAPIDAWSPDGYRVNHDDIDAYTNYDGLPAGGDNNGNPARSVGAGDPTGEAEPVPEPASIVLMGLGAAAMAARRRKKTA